MEGKAPGFLADDPVVALRQKTERRERAEHRYIAGEREIESSSRFGCFRMTWFGVSSQAPPCEDLSYCGKQILQG